MLRLRNRVQHYAWGSRTAIASLLGLPSPSPTPDAELWLGAHPAAPSVIVDGSGLERTLIDHIAGDPVATLGAGVVARFGAKLPFLLKVLAADEPLSLQAHPSAAQAEAGFEREERAGIALSSPQRSYKDRSHKPELICAVSPFDALYGFREPAQSLALFAALGVEALRPILAPLRTSPAAQALREVVVSVLSLPRDRAAGLASEVGAACMRAREAAPGPAAPFAAEYEWGARIAAIYPGDPGIVVALLLNLVRLAPGEALYLPAGNLHAYLQGVGIEIMASSDNVIRGGLTPKHIDVVELAQIVRFEIAAPRPIAPLTKSPGEEVYATPAPEFCLSRVNLEGRGADHEHDATRFGHTDRFVASDRRGPEILLGWEGTLSVDDGSRPAQVLGRGESLFVPASTGAYTITGTGVLFRAATGDLE